MRRDEKRYSQFVLAVIQNENEHEIPEERAHERRGVLLTVLVETENVEELEGIRREEGSLTVSTDEQINHPGTIAHVLDGQRGVEDKLQNNDYRSTVKPEYNAYKAMEAIWKKL